MSAKTNQYVAETYELARSATAKGNHPFGALLVLDSKIILEAENAVIVSGDSTQHAELRLISEACRLYSRAELSRATLYSSTEPCAMCAGAIYWAGIRHVVFGCSAKRLGDIAGSGLALACREVLRNAHEPVVVEGPILEELGALIHQTYWHD
jgi:tRNA(Arg) A34 adenosine deaminase TadA